MFGACVFRPNVCLGLACLACDHAIIGVNTVNRNIDHPFFILLQSSSREVVYRYIFDLLV